MNLLEINNKGIYINKVDIYKYIKTCTLYKRYNNLTIYTIKDTLFCNVVGVLNIYKENNKINKLEFSSVDLLRLFNISYLNYTYYFSKQIIELRNGLNDNYKQTKSNNYENDLYTFKLNVNECNFNILIERRI